jgi:hypothetical protein
MFRKGPRKAKPSAKIAKAKEFCNQDQYKANDAPERQGAKQNHEIAPQDRRNEDHETPQPTQNRHMTTSSTKQMKRNAPQGFRIRYIANSSPLEGGASTHNKQIDKHTKVSDERPLEGGEHIHA